MEELVVSIWLFPDPQMPCILLQSPWHLQGPPFSQVVEVTSPPASLGSWLGHQGVKVWLSTCFPGVSGNSNAAVNIIMSSFCKEDFHPLWSGPGLKTWQERGGHRYVVPWSLDRAAQNRRHKAWGEAEKETGRKRDSEWWGNWASPREWEKETEGDRGREKQRQKWGTEERTELVTVCGGGYRPRKRGSAKMLLGLEAERVGHLGITVPWVQGSNLTGASCVEAIAPGKMGPPHFAWRVGAQSQERSWREMAWGRACSSLAGKVQSVPHGEVTMICLRHFPQSLLHSPLLQHDLPYVPQPGVRHCAAPRAYSLELAQMDYWSQPKVFENKVHILLLALLMCNMIGGCYSYIYCWSQDSGL